MSVISRNESSISTRFFLGCLLYGSVVTLHTTTTRERISSKQISELLSVPGEKRRERERERDTYHQGELILELFN